ncbi:MAG: hypothetical protein IJ513_04885 [Bacteroidaceae bacterium]|nr:hypothetical protein [Bacteroidaceae bacterium]
MKRFTLILSLLVAMVTTAMAQIDVTKTYRIKDVASGNYLTAFNHDTHSTGAVGGVGIAALDENSDEQIFYLEPTSDGYIFRTKSDYHLVGWGWNVDAIRSGGTSFKLADAGSGQFYLMKGTTYFKTQTVGDLTYVFCDAPYELRATWVIEVVEENAVAYASYGNIDRGKAYVFKTSSRGGLTINDNATSFCSTNDAGRGVYAELAESKNHFAVVTYKEKDYLYSVAAKKFLKADQTLTNGLYDAVAFRDAAAEGASRMSLYFKDITNANINIGGENQIQVNWWSAIDYGNAMLLVEVDDFDSSALEIVDVTYEFTYNGQPVKETQKTSVLKGTEFPEIVVNFPYGISAKRPDGVVEENTVISIELVENRSFEYAANVEDVTTWYYAQIHSNNRTYFYDGGEGANIEWVTDRKTFTAAEIDNYSWAFVGNPFSGFKMVSKNGRAIVSTGGENDNVTMGTVDEATAFLAMPSKEDVVNGFCLMNPNVEGTWYMNAHDGYVKHWNNNDAGSTIVLTKRNDNEITVSDLGYATLYLGEPVFIPAEVEAYVVSSVDGEYAQMTQVTGILPANTGVILKNAGEYTFTTAPAADAIKDNLLAGTLETTEITKEEGKSYYVLANKNGIGFYNAVLGEDATKFKNAANKAYLVVPGASEVASYSFRFGEGTTGISEVKGESGNVKGIYDLTGRRVENISAPGIYIVGGKKVLVK